MSKLFHGRVFVWRVRGVSFATLMLRGGSWFKPTADGIGWVEVTAVEGAARSEARGDPAGRVARLTS
jgi:hypothetical protein